MARLTRSRSRPGAPRAAVAAALLAVAAVVAALLRRLKPPGSGGRGGAASTARPVTDPTAPPATRAREHDDAIECPGCGKGYRVSGAGRHRVIWPQGADERDALLDERCLECGHELAPEAANTVDRPDG